MEKLKIKIILEVLYEVSLEFLETKQFIKEQLEQKCLKEHISVEQIIYFLFTSLEAKS